MRPVRIIVQSPNCLYYLSGSYTSDHCGSPISSQEVSFINIYLADLKSFEQLNQFYRSISTAFAGGRKLPRGPPPHFFIPDTPTFDHITATQSTMQAVPESRQQTFEEIYGPPENFLEVEVIPSPLPPCLIVPLVRSLIYHLKNRFR
ncbi:hypothetical protein ASPWEDRAFT_562227 [Aspergillus wentii DTO 134E9]|uniref:Uncharacterized protein n=1 Tax=Aspergillus wentii DTO 134E9 TaxID=1073089 RepID=A0A1L9RGW9_ASPWE|nr:uncharacterized protein ASPWEDRAFT_562227 [Aspergillus wentii DTO 134E9]OJJ34154.1 hypothetical protein ASPWEDRAFT_562227 [Aspergillus wentii DTO 134E9]